MRTKSSSSRFTAICHKAASRRGASRSGLSCAALAVAVVLTARVAGLRPLDGLWFYYLGGTGGTGGAGAPGSPPLSAAELAARRADIQRLRDELARKEADLARAQRLGAVQGGDDGAEGAAAGAGAGDEAAASWDDQRDVGLVQRALFRHQNPPDCATAKYGACPLPFLLRTAAWVALHPDGGRTGCTADIALRHPPTVVALLSPATCIGTTD